jgi:hypothetical protein
MLQWNVSRLVINDKTRGAGGIVRPHPEERVACFETALSGLLGMRTMNYEDR